MRSYLDNDHPDKPLEIGLERTLGEHIDVLVGVFNEVRRVMKPKAALWLNYGDCYATTPNGRSAADTKAAGNDDRTFRDKPFSTIGPVYDPGHASGGFRGDSKRASVGEGNSGGRVVAGGYLKPKDLCLIPFRLAIALQEDGWWVRSRCIWGKPNGMPDSSGRYRPSVAHEEIFLLSKSGDLEYDADAVSAPCSASTHARLAQNVQDQIGSTRANGGRKTNGNMKAVVRKKQDGHGRRYDGFNERYFGNVRDNESMDSALAIMPERRFLRSYEPEVWHIATAAFSDAHFATFPPALVERCLMASCPEGGLVLDPFGGAGTVGMVADRMQRNAILCDLNADYVSLAQRRIEKDGGMFTEVAAE